MTKNVIALFVCLGFSVSLHGMSAPETAPARPEKKSPAPASSHVPCGTLADCAEALSDELAARFAHVRLEPKYAPRAPKIEKSFSYMRALLCMGSEKAYFQVGTAPCFKSNSPYVLHNCVFDLTTHISKELVQAVCDDMKGVPFCWWVDKLQQKQQAEQLLVAGFVERPDKYTAMITNISDNKKIDVDIDVDVEDTKGITVAQLTEKQLSEFAHLSATGFAISPGHQQRVLEHIIKTHGQSNIRFYAAEIKTADHDEPILAASCMVIMHPVDNRPMRKSHISLHFVSTLSSFRDHGLEVALIKRVLYDARKQGCSQAIVLSSFEMLSMYKTMGFIAIDINGEDAYSMYTKPA